jgi:hypothetical protein
MVSNWSTVLEVGDPITILSRRALAEIAVWRAPKPAHRFKYRLAFVIDGECG